MRMILMPVEMPQDHEGVRARSSGATDEAREVPELEVP